MAADFPLKCIQRGFTLCTEKEREGEGKREVRERVWGGWSARKHRQTFAT